MRGVVNPTVISKLLSDPTEISLLGMSTLQYAKVLNAWSKFSLIDPCLATKLMSFSERLAKSLLLVVRGLDTC